MGATVVPAPDDVAEVQPPGSIVDLSSVPKNVSVSGPPPVTRCFTPVLPSVPGSPSSPVKVPNSSPVAVTPSPVHEIAINPPALSMSQIIEAAVADALIKQQAAFSSMVSAQVASISAHSSAAGVAATVGPTINQVDKECRYCQHAILEQQPPRTFHTSAVP